MDFLAKMRASAFKRAAELEAVYPDGPAVRPLRPVLKNMAVIAEVKYATPAEGDLGVAESPEQLAAIYEEGGAAAISCLTEPEYFKGSLDYLSRIRAVSRLPIVMKDFIVDERQIAAGRCHGADAYLLIAEMLEVEELSRLLSFGRRLGMPALVEVHGTEGLAKLRGLEVEIVGVNVRDLASLKVHPERHAAMVGLLPAGAIKVAESGITAGARLKQLGQLGYDAALIGRGLVNAASRGNILCG